MVPASNVEGDEVCWTIEVRRSDDPSLGTRQVRVFHYGELVDNRWIREWTYPENGDEYEEVFYVPVSAEELTTRDINIPREGQGSNVGLWIVITDTHENGQMPYVDLFYIITPMIEGNQIDGSVPVERHQYDAVFAYQENLIG